MLVDPHDTFSPVARIVTIRTLLALAAAEGATVRTGDVPAAYVKALMEDDVDVYMSQPKGFEGEGKEGWYCKLDKALYGLPQAGRLWNQKCSQFLVKNLGFIRSKADPCLYMLRRDGAKMAISLTVDDFLEFSTCPVLHNHVVNALAQEFDYINDGPASWFLGMAVKQTYKSITLNQHDFINSIIGEEERCPWASKHRPIPLRCESSRLRIQIPVWQAQIRYHDPS